MHTAWNPRCDPNPNGSRPEHDGERRVSSDRTGLRGITSMVEAVPRHRCRLFHHTIDRIRYAIASGSDHCARFQRIYIRSGVVSQFTRARFGVAHRPRFDVRPSQRRPLGGLRAYLVRTEHVWAAGFNPGPGKGLLSKPIRGTPTRRRYARTARNAQTRAVCYHDRARPRHGGLELCRAPRTVCQGGNFTDPRAGRRRASL